MAFQTKVQNRRSKGDLQDPTHTLVVLQERYVGVILLSRNCHNSKSFDAMVCMMVPFICDSEDQSLESGEFREGLQRRLSHKARPIWGPTVTADMQDDPARLSHDVSPTEKLDKIGVGVKRRGPDKKNIRGYVEVIFDVLDGFGSVSGDNARGTETPCQRKSGRRLSICVPKVHPKDAVLFQQICSFHVYEFAGSHNVEVSCRNQGLVNQ